MDNKVKDLTKVLKDEMSEFNMGLIAFESGKAAQGAEHFLKAYLAVDDKNVNKPLYSYYLAQSLKYLPDNHSKTKEIVNLLVSADKQKQFNDDYYCKAVSGAKLIEFAADKGNKRALIEITKMYLGLHIPNTFYFAENQKNMDKAMIYANKLLHRNDDESKAMAHLAISIYYYYMFVYVDNFSIEDYKENKNLKKSIDNIVKADRIAQRIGLEDIDIDHNMINAYTTPGSPYFNLEKAYPLAKKCGEKHYDIKKQEYDKWLYFRLKEMFAKTSQR